MLVSEIIIFQVLLQKHYLFYTFCKFSIIHTIEKLKMISILSNSKHRGWEKMCTRNINDGAAIEVLGEQLGVEGSTHQDDLQVRSVG